MLRLMCVLMLVPSLAFGQLSPAERKGINDALYIGGFSASDLEFPRTPWSDPTRMPIIERAIRKPLESADEMLRIHAGAASGTAKDLIQTALQMSGASEVKPPALAGEPIVPAEVPDAAVGPLKRLILAIARANAEIRAAESALDAEDKRNLIESLPGWAVEDPIVKFDFVRRKPLLPSPIQLLLAKIDLPRIWRAGAVLAGDVEEAANALKGVSASLITPVRFTTEGVTVVVAGSGNDAHEDRDAMLTIDFGGDDRYLGRHGAGIGYASVVIDLAGNDEYAGPDANFGCGLLGVGILLDAKGDDVYRGKSLGLGCGLAGVGILEDNAGRDRYDGIALTQGFGEFGIGLQLDSQGDDDYRAALYAQGAARTQGVGWLVDRGGNDDYRAGGLLLNSPLFEDVHYSNAQGYGAGYREDTGGLSGGVGLLTDLGGDDAYIAETYAQGASYWYSLGSLFDAAGNDTYRAHHYAQASAMHCTAAQLFDLAGDDVYAVNYGAGHAIGHDYGVAILLDRAGNDVYAGRDSRPGIGNANGLGIFVDSAGDDRYAGPPAQANPARGMGSLGLFVDLDGTDQYGDGLANGEGAVRPAWAMAWDQDGKPATIAPTPPGQEATAKAGSIARPSDQDLEALYRDATQWGVGTAVASQQAALNRLVGIGMPALEWMIQFKLPASDRLQNRAFVTVIGAIGDSARQRIAAELASSDDDRVRNALSICIDAKAKASPQLLGPLLKRAAVRRLATRAVGALGVAGLANDLMPLCLDSDPFTAQNAVVSLSELNDPTTYPTAESLLNSANPLVRRLAVSWVAKSPEKAMATALRLSESSDEGQVRMGIEVWSALGTPEALAKLEAMLDDRRAGVRISALVALSGRFSESGRRRLSELQRDNDPRVRAVARRVDIGR